MRDDIVSRREVMASLVAEYNRRYSEGGLKLAWIEKAVNDTPALQPSGGRLIDADKLKQHYAWWPENERTVLDQIVDVQPTVEAVPVVHGKWIDGLDVPKEERERQPYVYLHGEKYCSACYEEAYFDTDYGQQFFDYCPNCGAKMKG